MMKPYKYYLYKDKLRVVGTTFSFDNFKQMEDKFLTLENQLQNLPYTIRSIPFLKIAIPNYVSEKTQIW